MSIEWIKTSDRLPEECGNDFLGVAYVTTKWHDGREETNGVWVPMYYAGNGRWVDEEANDEKPSYWLQVPPIPAPDEKEKP